MKKVILMMAVCAITAATADAQADWPEIDKNLMTATASSIDHGSRPGIERP